VFGCFKGVLVDLAFFGAIWLFQGLVWPFFVWLPSDVPESFLSSQMRVWLTLLKKNTTTV